MADITNTIELSDFSAGIHADLHAGLSTTARGSIPVNGAATIDGTFGCCADPSGALVPLPTVQSSKSDTTIYTNDAETHHPLSKRAAYLTDALISTGGYNTSSSYRADTEGRVNVLTAYYQLLDAAGTGLTHYLTVLGRMYKYSGTAIDFFWDYGSTSAPGNAIYPAMLAAHRTISQAPAAPADFSGWVKAGVAMSAWLGSARIPTAIPAAVQPFTTFDTDVSANYPVDNVTSTTLNGALVAFPRPSTPTVDSVFPFYTAASLTNQRPVAPTLMVTHQGRVVVTEFSMENIGTNTFYMRDSIFYLPVQDFALLNGGTGYSFTIDGSGSGFGVIASASVDELLLVHHRGGATLIRGDLDNPTMVRLPGLESTYGVSSAAINTPIGLVYGSRNGVFLWNGGQNSDKLSKQLEGFFWDHTAGEATETYGGSRGRFGWFHPWVAVPNNFLFDTRTGGWWRLSDPADRGDVPYNIYGTDPTTGNLYAFPYKLTGTQQVVYDVFDPATLRSDYTWKSQPLVGTLDRVHSFHELQLVASPGTNTQPCTVTVTLTGFDTTGTPVTSTTTFNFTGTGTPQPIIIRKDIAPNFQASYVQVAVASDGGTGVAPKIHSLKLGIADRAQIAKS